MIDRFSFVNSHWIGPILISALFILIVFAWKERSHYGKSKFIIHLGVSFIAILSLVLIALQPQIRIKKETQVAAIVTEGYNEVQLDSLKKTNKKLKIFPYKIGETILDADKIPSSVFVLGNGIRAFDLWQLENIPTFYLGGKELKGVTQLKYDYYQTKGNRVQFNGVYNNPTKNNWLLLEGPGGRTLDSLSLTDDKSQLFEVSTNLTITGNFNFHLIEKDSLGTVLSKDILPLTIVEKTPLKILILNGFPTFESKYLKNYLAETGHEVVVKNQLTTERYKYEYFNMTSKPIIDITEETLEPYDLLIIDTKSLNDLSNRQLNSLKKAVIEIGIGILIQPDANYFSSKKSLSSFNFDPETSKDAVLKAYPKQNIKKYPYQFREDFSLQPIQSSGSKIWSSYKHLGSGKVGTTLFQNTFELVLTGHAETYHYLWSEIIEKISKRKTPSVQWSASHNFAFLHEPYKFELRTTIPNPKAESSEGYSIPLQRDVHVKNLWRGKVYPREIGWKQQFIHQDSTALFQYYVTDSSQWKTMTQFNTIKTNQNYFNDTSKLNYFTRDTLELINPLWFFVIFILCSGYLWLEPKL